MERLDAWDRAAARARGDTSVLIELGRRYLIKRKDQALGLAPTRLLPSREAGLWILYWSAARRVDDSVEAGRTTPDDWLRRLASSSPETFQELCVEAVLHDQRLRDVDVEARLRLSLRGLAMEAKFSRARKSVAYERLLEHKSVPTMQILNSLLFPDERASRLDAHAHAFAMSTQLGDDCRDVFRDLKRDRCFITQEELDAHEPVVTAKSSRFTLGRATMCRSWLDAAGASARGFRSSRARRRAGKLDSMWRYALDSGQVRPTRQKLALPGLN